MSLQLLSTMLLAAKIKEMSEDYVNENGFAGVPVPQTQVSMEENSFITLKLNEYTFFSSQSSSWYP